MNSGTKPPNEVFEKGICLGKGAYGSVWEVSKYNNNDNNTK